MGEQLIEDSHVTLVLRFGVFEMDLRTGELRKSGVLVHLGPQPYKVLALLASRAGKLVTRDEIQREIWGENTYVDYEQGLRVAIKKIRAALGDRSSSPRYIETLSRRGYRFIAPVEVEERPDGFATISAEVPDGSQQAHSSFWYLPGLMAAGLAIALTVLLLAFNIGGFREKIFGKSMPQIKSIAVLPLEDLSQDPGQQYFADGMTDDLITDLGKIKALRVISRTTMMRYKGTSKTLPEIARELNVDAIVEGTVLRDGGRVRITANLLYARTDRHLWAGTFERNLGDVLALQDDVARDIANQVQLRLTGRELARLSHPRPVNISAYDDYLKGRYFRYKWTVADLEKSINYFQQAIHEDPQYGAAYAGLAEAQFVLGYLGQIPPTESYDKGMQAATRALQIDDTLAQAYTAMAALSAAYQWNFTRSEAEFKRAIQLNPNYAVAHLWYAHFLMFLHRWDDCFRESRIAEQLDPLSPMTTSGFAARLTRAGKYNEAFKELQAALEIAPNFPPTHWSLGFLYQQQGDLKKAIPEYRTEVKLSGGSPQSLGALGYALAVSGDKKDAMRLEAQLARKRRGGYVPVYPSALIELALGNKRQAMDLIEKAYEQHSRWMTYINLDSRLEPLRSDPRFEELQRRIGLPQ